MFWLIFLTQHLTNIIITSRKHVVFFIMFQEQIIQVIAKDSHTSHRDVATKNQDFESMSIMSSFSLALPSISIQM
jgi:hypothetical protein